MTHFVITCVKIGTKYPYGMVNNLFNMCKKNISLPFDFFCYTDDSSGLDPGINAIQYVDNQLDIIVYNKLFLFSDWMNNILPPGPRVFFDLDLVIKHNIDDILLNEGSELTLIDAEWRQKYDYGFPIFHHPFNSSCMKWNSRDPQRLWEMFISDPEYYLNKYHWGMDSFMFYEKENANVKIEYFPTRKFYSFLYGVDYAENIIHDPITQGYRPSKFINIVKNIPIVLFNGPVDNSEYLKQYHKLYGD